MVRQSEWLNRQERQELQNHDFTLHGPGVVGRSSSASAGGLRACEMLWETETTPRGV